MVRVGDLIAIMEEIDFDGDDTIDTDSLEFEVNTVTYNKFTIYKNCNNNLVTRNNNLIIIYLTMMTFSICLK